VGGGGEEREMRIRAWSGRAAVLVVSPFSHTITSGQWLQRIDTAIAARKPTFFTYLRTDVNIANNHAWWAQNNKVASKRFQICCGQTMLHPHFDRLHAEAMRIRALQRVVKKEPDDEVVFSCLHTAVVQHIIPPRCAVVAPSMGRRVDMARTKAARALGLQYAPIFY